MPPAAAEHYWTTTRNSLRTLAELTGGFALADHRLSDALERISSVMRD